MWRKSKEPELAFKVATIISFSFWIPLFFIPFLLPSSTWWAGRPGNEPRFAGQIIYPNLLVAGVFLLLTVIGYWIGRPIDNQRSGGERAMGPLTTRA
jgi:hypothetical protein